MENLPKDTKIDMYNIAPIMWVLFNLFYYISLTIIAIKIMWWI
jgi:hypothetical protein